MIIKGALARKGKLFKLELRNEILTMPPAIFCMCACMRHARVLNLSQVKHAFGDLYAQELAVHLVYLLSTSC